MNYGGRKQARGHTSGRNRTFKWDPVQSSPEAERLLIAID